MKMNTHLLSVERKEMGTFDPSKRRLHMCERTLPFGESLFNSFRDSITPEDLMYYSGDLDLRQKLAEHHGVEVENIFVGAGSDSVLNTIFDVFVSPGSNVYMPEAHFPMYDVYLGQNQGIKKTFKYELYNQKLKLNTSIEYNNINLIILGNPNSPVGDLVSLSNIERLARVAPLVLDQAYGAFGKTEVPIEWIDRGIMFVNTFSKSWGAAGCRVGYCIASKEIVSLLNKRKRMFELSTVSKKFAMFLLDNKEVVDDYVQQIVNEREFLKTKLNLVQYGNWIHLPQHKYSHITKSWEVKQNATLPKLFGEFLRVTIFPDINEYL